MNWVEEQVKHYQRDAEVADLFGLIVYTKSHANILKVLRDDDYWQAFDAVSGPRLAVFSIRALPPEQETQGGTSMGFMRGKAGEPEENISLLRDLGLSGSNNFPLLLLFTRDGDDIYRIAIPLDDTSEAAAYQSIKDNLTLVAETLAAVDPTNLKEPLGLTGAMNLAIDHREGVKMIRKATDLFLWIKKFLP